MEVHHHSHSGHSEPRKKWMHYFWEFLMLFLAVFCGFLAEYQLEHQIEKDREKQFIQSMVKELEADTAQLHRVMTDSVRKYAMDTLLRKLYADTMNETDIRYIYYMKRKYLH